MPNYTKNVYINGNEFEELRLERLNKTLKQCCKSPLYAKKHQGLHSEVTRLKDIEQYPLTTKEELRECAPFGNLTVPMNQVV